MTAAVESAEYVRQKPNATISTYVLPLVTHSVMESSAGLTDAGEHAVHATLALSADPTVNAMT